MPRSGGDAPSTRPARRAVPPATPAQPTGDDEVLSPIARPTEYDRALAETVSKGWWILLLSGIVSAIAGILILSIDWTVEDLGLFVAILFIVRGVFQTMEVPMDGSGRGWNVTVGVIEILVGIAFVSWPDIGLYTLAIFLASWVIL